MQAFVLLLTGIICTCKGDPISALCDLGSAGMILLSQAEGGTVVLDFGSVTLPSIHHWALHSFGVVKVDQVPNCSSGGPPFAPLADLSYADLSARYGSPSGLITTNLEFFTGKSIAGRSLVFSDATGRAVGCCTIVILGGLKPGSSATPLYSPTDAQLWCNLSTLGSFVLTAMTAPAPELRLATRISWNLIGLNDSVSFHVHSSPVTDNNCNTAGGHYNPPALGVSNVVGASGSLFGLGELSNKHGVITPTSPEGAIVDAGVWITPNCASTASCNQFPTVHSTPAKSIVVHDAASGARLDCCTLEAQPSTLILNLPEVPTVNAECLFTSSTGQEVSGYLTFAQSLDNDGVIVRGKVNFCFADQQSKTHSYHIHSFAAEGDGATCAAAGPHYGGATLQDLWGPSADGLSFGSSSAYNFMEIGDLAGKHGLLGSNGLIGPFVDGQVHLSGPYSVLGRSVVIHDGPLRLGCCTIQASEFVEDDPDFDRSSVCPFQPVGQACTSDNDCGDSIVCDSPGRSAQGVPTGRCVGLPGVSCRTDSDCTERCLGGVCELGLSPSPPPSPVSDTSTISLF